MKKPRKEVCRKCKQGQHLKCWKEWMFFDLTDLNQSPQFQCSCPTCKP